MIATELLAFLLLPIAAGNEKSFSPAEDNVINYQNITPFCPLGEFCADEIIPKTVAYYAGCKCDKECGAYGDCCRDSPYFRPSQELPTQLCFAPLGSPHPIRMVGSCPPEAGDVENLLCESPGDSNPLLAVVPISVNTTDYGIVTFKNVYCAQCNDVERTEYQLWYITVSCKPKVRNGSLIWANNGNVMWDKEMKQWVNFIGGERTNCDMSVVPPAGLKNRNCSGKRIVETCPVDWADSNVADLCKSYNAEIRAGTNRSLSNVTIYRNKYCFECNEGNPDDVICDIAVDFRPRTAITRKKGKTIIQSIIIIINITHNHCKSGEIYDPFLQMCTVLLPPRATREVNLRLFQNNTVRETNYSWIDLCPRFVFNSTEFQVSADNRTVSLPKYSLNFTAEHFRLTVEGNVEICADDIPDQVPDTFSLFMSIITMFGLAVSIFFLLVHLCAVALVAELRNLSGFSLASLCLALLAAYASFIAGGLLPHMFKEWCYYVAILTYYFFMSAFFWMMILAFDVWRLLRESVRHLRTLHGLQWKRFLSYTVVAWGTPFLFVASTVYIESAPQGVVDDRLRPKFGLQNCWFGNPTSLLFFFAIPLTVIMVINMGFFIFAAVVTSNNSAATGHRKNFRLYVKLTIMLGLTWIAGLLASVLDSNVLWGVFSVLNTLQGFFIFVMFTLTSRVLSGLSRTFPCYKSQKETFPQRHTPGTRKASFSSSKPTSQETET